MWEEVFPGAIINRDIVECHELVTYIANLFKFDNKSDLESRLVINYKIESDIASKVVFLINLLDLRTDNAFDLYKQKTRSNCQTSTIIDWLDANNIHRKIFIRFIDYAPSVSAEELMSQGFKGKELGQKIKDLEIKKFKDLLR
jgi:hypothetical protein